MATAPSDFFFTLFALSPFSRALPYGLWPVVNQYGIIITTCQTMKEQISPLMDARRARERMDVSGVVVVDARGGSDARERYAAGHAPGAFFVDLETELSAPDRDPAQGGRHPLPEPRTFGALLGRLGITPETEVLVYDDRNGAMAAARFWWMMRSVGHTRVYIVDGGLNALMTSGMAMTWESVVPPGGSPYPVDAWQWPTANITEIETRLSEGSAIVVDVRESYRYRGESEPIDPVAGHIPGAINLPYTENLNPDGTFRKADELRGQFNALAEGREIIVHCGSGVTACHTIVAMATAGLRPPTLYVGSWGEWVRNGKPVATARPGD